MKVLPAAADEDRTRMLDLWADLLANATAGVPIEDEFIPLLERMNPHQAQMLRSLMHQGGAGFQVPFATDQLGQTKAMNFQLLQDLVRLFWHNKNAT